MGEEAACSRASRSGGSERAHGVTSDTMVWSLDGGWSQASQQPGAAYTGFGGDSERVAVSEVTARASASLRAHRHVCRATKLERGPSSPGHPVGSAPLEGVSAPAWRSDLHIPGKGGEGLSEGAAPALLLLNLVLLWKIFPRDTRSGSAS